MAPSEEPAAKKRKLTSTNSLPLRPPLQLYVPLARGAIALEPPSNASVAILPNSRLPVATRTVSKDGSHVVIYCISRSKRIQPLLRLHLATRQDAHALEVLRDCAQLESIWRYQHDSRILPLACAIGILTVDDAGEGGGVIYQLKCKILWRNSLLAHDRVSTQLSEILQKYQPSESNMSELDQAWSPQDFYDNVHIPQKTIENSAELKVDLLQCQLYPFQRRAVRWLLSREGVVVKASGEIVPSNRTSQDELSDLFRQSTDAHGRQCYVSHALSSVSTDLDLLRSKYQAVNGGILAEEMGLGKTVEMLALICLHRRCLDQGLASTGDSPLISGATLIITPISILEQWKREVREHAPSLKVFHYEGLRASTRGTRESDLSQFLAEQDVVLTTYTVISREVHYATEKPERNMRHKQRFESPKSPLTQISWWRVCLDEAQNVESGVSNASKVARLIPRINAWAVSGTPLKSSHRDLFGLLLFLKYDPWCQSLQTWNRLLDCHRPVFRNMLGRIALRHSKESVREDLRLPPQTRHTITMSFTAIEEQHYAQLFYAMCQDCGLDRHGNPLTDDWDPESSIMLEKMRNWLSRLRQTCLHPEVGGRNRRALGRSGGPLRSVMQVLEVMIDQNDSALRAEQRAVLLMQARRGQMLENAKNTEAAVGIWSAAYKEACSIVDDCRKQLSVELQNQDSRQLSTHETTDSEEDGDVDTRAATYRYRLRAALEVKHICIFFLGNGYFQIKSDETKVMPDSEDFKVWEQREEAAYEEAKSIRAEMLLEPLNKANRSMKSVQRRATGNAVVIIPEMRLTIDYGGIESKKIFEKLYQYCQAMNEQAKQFTGWRTTMAEFLQQSLIDEDEGKELQGDEYESSTKHQDEVYAYMEVIRAAYADRNDALTGQMSTLIVHEMKVALQAAKRGEGPAPERLIAMLADRERMRVPPELGSLRGIITEIRHLITALQWQDGAGKPRARAELSIANEILRYTQQMSADQMNAIASLEKEVELFRETMNNRLEYYRALQRISDTVAPYQEEEQGKPLNTALFDRVVGEERRREHRIAGLLSKRRYLEHLRAEQDVGSSTQTQRLCIICQSDFENGTLTVCGHQFCKECIRLWWSEHRTCPMCKKNLRAADFYDITYKPSELIVADEDVLPSSSNSPQSSERILNRSIYSDVSAITLNQIKNVDLESSYFGTKVDTMCRHLFWLRDHDPGSKVIIFSQYKDFLDVLSRAFKQYKIAYSRFEEKEGAEKFKTDPAVECFLLHAKAHAAGLNLVVASHVILCEPLINTAIELQAIARVHRIGQHRATTVWMYLVADSVEESIYEISVARRLEHMKSRIQASSSRSGTVTPNAIMESTIDAANSLEMQEADFSKLLTSGQGGGEVVRQDDVWKCLFGRVREREAGFSAHAAHSEVGRFLRAGAAQERQG